MDKKVSYLWSFGIGLMFVVFSLVAFLSGLGGETAEMSILNYLIIFLSGATIGLVLVYFLRRSDQPVVFNATLIAFAIGLPFAMFGIIFGGIVGGVGIFLLGVSPAAFITGLGYYIARTFTGK